MHFSIEMIRQPPIVIQPTQIGTAHIADLEFLVARGPGGVGEGLEFALFLLFRLLGGAHFEEFRHGA